MADFNSTIVPPKVINNVQNTSNIGSSLNDLISKGNKKLKSKSNFIAVWIFVIMLIVTIVLYIISSFITTNIEVWVYIAGYLLLVSCTVILFLFANLCLNNRKKSILNQYLTNNFQI